MALRLTVSLDTQMGGILRRFFGIQIGVGKNKHAHKYNMGNIWKSETLKVDGDSYLAGKPCIFLVTG